MPLASPWIIAPLKPSLVVRSSSSAAAFGSLVGRAAKAAKRFGLAAHDGVEPVIDAPCKVGRVVAGELLRRWRAVREDLHVDARLVHFLEAHLAEIVQALEHFRIAHGFTAHELRGQFLVPVVLFQRDHRTFQPWQHDAFSPARSMDDDAS